MSALTRNAVKNTLISPTMHNEVLVIGGGLAGSEAAIVLANAGIKVRLVDCKPSVRSAAHSSNNYAEVVCSNSFKSNDPYTASGLIKEELRILGSPLIAAADRNRVPAGGALAVDRTAFSQEITDIIAMSENITTECRLVDKVDFSQPTVIAVGPLGMSPIGEFLQSEFGDNLGFYDAEAPIVDASSIDYQKTFSASRYDKGDDDYVNCPLTKDEYYDFVKELVSARRAVTKDFDKRDIFEGCMPVEIMASRGVDTLRFGPLKPVGMVDKDGKRPFAVVQLRKENVSATMYNIVGFQTNLAFDEQRRVFGMIPALRNAEYFRYGVMHRNMYINAPKVIEGTFATKKYPSCFIAGQLSGVEGYVESIASGHIAALNIIRLLKGKPPIILGNETMIGALCSYLCVPSDNFQPMNANFGLLKSLDENIRDKSLKKKTLALRAIESITHLKTFDLF